MQAGGRLCCSERVAQANGGEVQKSQQKRTSRHQHHELGNWTWFQVTVAALRANHNYTLPHAIVGLSLTTYCNLSPSSAATAIFLKPAQRNKN